MLYLNLNMEQDSCFTEEVRKAYPMPKKDETMYLRGFAKESRKFEGERNWKSSSFVTFPNQPLHTRVKPRANTILRTDDLAQYDKRPLRSKPYQEHSSLWTKDIEIGRSKSLKFFNRAPPDQENVPIEYEIPRFIRDPLAIEDIKGARSCWRTKENSSFKPPANYRTIVTSQLQKMVFSDNIGRDYLKEQNEHRRIKEEALKKVEDKKIAPCSKNFRLSSRSVDPLDPNYFYYDENKNPVFLGKFKTKNEQKANLSGLRESMNLFTHDITGATTQPLDIVKLYANKNIYKDPLLHSDIPGTVPGSIKKTIKTNRCLNPNDRLYNLTESHTEGFEVGTEYKNPMLMAPKKHHGKKITENSKYLNDINNWDFINQEVKDKTRPPVNEKAPKGKGLFNRGLNSDICFLTSKEKIKPIPNINKGTRNILLGSGINEEDLFSSGIIFCSDEEKLQKYEQLLKNHEKRKLIETKETLKQPISHEKPSKKANLVPKLKNKFEVTFKPLSCNAEKFDSFINFNKN